MPNPTILHSKMILEMFKLKVHASSPKTIESKPLNKILKNQIRMIGENSLSYDQNRALFTSLLLLFLLLYSFAFRKKKNTLKRKFINVLQIRRHVS